ncbi:MAG: M55 family metallopeptidase [Lentisphaerae bacterium]|nr:M55 family metallopeptidase [Lentisphaerota bacterium]
MKLYMMVDMEGINGIQDESQIMPDGANYPQGRQYVTHDVNACLAGCFDAGARQVIVRFAHGYPQHFIWEQLDPRAEYVTGGSHERMPGLRGAAGMLLVGYHAMAGTRRAVLDHTMSSRGWQNFWINDRLSGEIAIDAAIAGDAGVPTIFTSGDDKACAEARGFLPGVVTAQVKEGLSRESARLLSAEKARELLRERAAAAVRAAPRLRPYRVRHPVRVRLELCTTKVPPEARPGVKIIDGRTYEVRGKNMEDALNAL